MADPPCVFLTLAVGFVLTTTASGVANLTENPPPDMPKWTVRDDNNNICMLMAINATLTSFLGQEYSVPQTAKATPVSGSCHDDSAYFTLSWAVDGFTYPNFKINILFNRRGGTYKMDQVNGTEETAIGVFSSWNRKSPSFPSAAVGRSMTCIDFEAGSLFFEFYQFQPFAQQSNAEFGEVEECSDVNWLLTLASVVVAFGFVLVVGAVILIIALILRMQRQVNYTRIK